MRSFLASTLLAFAIVTPALAAPPGGTITLSNNTPTFGDTITVTGSDPSGYQSYVGLRATCDTDFDGEPNVYYPGSLWVRTDQDPIPDASFNMTLSANHWLSGPADCTAYYRTTKDGSRTRVLATLTFTVSG